MRTLTQNVALLDSNGNPLWYGPAYGNADVDDDVAAQIGELAFAELDERGNPLPPKPAAPVEQVEEVDEKPLDQRNKDELVKLADANGIDSSGTKAEVLDRLVVAGIEG